MPALNYNGNTYLPLKSIGDVLGSKLIWNNELKRVEVGEGTNKPIPTPIETIVPTPTPIPTPNPPLIISNYVSVIKVNGDIYQCAFPIGLTRTENGIDYITANGGGATIPWLIAYGSGEYTISTSNNPLSKGVLTPNIGDGKFLKFEEKFINLSRSYLEMTFYNKDHSKSYFVSTNLDNKIGVAYGELNLVPIKDLLTTLGISYTIEMDDKNKLIIWSFH